MNSEKLKEYLIQIAGNIKEETRLDDVYDQLALLSDIDESEEQEKTGEVMSHDEVTKKAQEWLK